MNTMPDIAAQLRLLAAVAHNPDAFARLWIACIKEMHASVALDPNGGRKTLRAFWPIDEHHGARATALQVLTVTLDDAGARPTLFKILTSNSEIAA